MFLVLKSSCFVNLGCIYFATKLGLQYLPIQLIYKKIRTLPRPINFKVERYIGGLSQFKKIDNPIKLSANEAALGPSPKAIQAYVNDKGNIFKYPESDSKSLREVLSEKFNIDSKRIICGAGSDQIFDLKCHLFLEPEDEVIVTEFGFIMHRI